MRKYLSRARFKWGKLFLDKNAQFQVRLVQTGPITIFFGGGRGRGRASEEQNRIEMFNASYETKITSSSNT